MSDYPIVQIVQALLSEGWKFFQIQVPGCPFTFAQALIGTLIIYISLEMLGLSFGIGGGFEFDSDRSYYIGRGGSEHEKPHFTWRC